MVGFWVLILRYSSRGSIHFRNRYKYVLSLATSAWKNGPRLDGIKVKIEIISIARSEIIRFMRLIS
jgi:hypothetical protein